MAHTSAAGLISFLSDESDDIKAAALRKLDNIVDTFWIEIPEHLPTFVTLATTETFPEHKLAALIASKVFYHLGELKDAMSYALEAGDKFDVNEKSEFVSTIILECIDSYTKSRVHQYNTGEIANIDPRLEDIVNRMFKRCLDEGEFKQAAGVALEARREDIIETCITNYGNTSEILEYLFQVVTTLVGHRGWRNQILEVIARHALSLSTPDYFMAAQCYTFLDDPTPVAHMIARLIAEKKSPLAKQLAFTLYDTATQQFVDSICNTLISTVEASATSVCQGDECTLPTDEEKEDASMSQALRHIMKGDISLPLYVQFLSRANKSDPLILTTTRDDTQRNNVCGSAVVIANGFSSAGTTSDAFLRDNREWVAKATNWSKFSVVASLGVIHKGHLDASMNVLSPYLPKDGVSNAPYERSGAFYALGLIHAGHGAGVKEYLTNHLRSSTTEIEKHGASLGLGLAAMASGDEALANELQGVCDTDSAVAGEAASTSIGLVMLGSANAQVVETMINYAHSTEHEKIIRGLATGIAMIYYGRREEANDIIDQLCNDKDYLLRISGMNTIALAYAGTNDNTAIRRLLHVGVSDVREDVRRAAIIAIGFLLFRTPEQCPSVVSLLCESFNPHVRYGAVMALGIACAGTGLKEAIALVEPMTSDSVPFVRQGAFVALGLIMIQQSFRHPKTESIRKLFAKTVADKTEDTLAKVGAIYAQGIIDAGGRNVTIAHTRGGHMNTQTVIGLYLFTQYWHWFPMAHFLSLAFTPTTVICVTPDLKVPKLSIVSNAKPSLFAYPPATEPPKAEVKEKVTTAKLSFTQRILKQQLQQQIADVLGQAGKKEEKKPQAQEAKMDTSADSKPAEPAKPKEPEPDSETLTNAVRVVPAQLSKITFPENSRFRPVSSAPLANGIVVVEDTTPGEPIEEVAVAAQAAETKEATTGAPEPEPPKPFEFDPNVDE